MGPRCGLLTTVAPFVLDTSVVDWELTDIAARADFAAVIAGTTVTQLTTGLQAQPPITVDLQQSRRLTNYNFPEPLVEQEYIRFNHSDSKVPEAVIFAVAGTALAVFKSTAVDAYTSVTATSVVWTAVGIAGTGALLCAAVPMLQWLAPTSISTEKLLALSKASTLVWIAATVAIQVIDNSSPTNCYRPPSPTSVSMTDACSTSFQAAEAAAVAFTVYFTRRPIFAVAAAMLLFVSSLLLSVAVFPYYSGSQVALRHVCFTLLALTLLALNVGRDIANRLMFEAIVQAHIAQKHCLELRTKLATVVDRVLPTRFASRLAKSASPRLWDADAHATVCVTSIFQFQKWSLRKRDAEVCASVHQLFTVLDGAARVFGVDEATTFGDQYFVTAGLMSRSNDATHAVRFAVWQQTLPQAVLPPLVCVVVTGALEGGLLDSTSTTALRYLLVGPAVERAMETISQVPERCTWVCSATAAAVAACPQLEGVIQTSPLEARCDMFQVHIDINHTNGNTANDDGDFEGNPLEPRRGSWTEDNESPPAFVAVMDPEASVATAAQASAPPSERLVALAKVALGAATAGSSPSDAAEAVEDDLTTQGAPGDDLLVGFLGGFNDAAMEAEYRRSRVAVCAAEQWRVWVIAIPCALVFGTYNAVMCFGDMQESNEALAAFILSVLLATAIPIAAGIGRALLSAKAGANQRNASSIGTAMRRTVAFSRASQREQLLAAIVLSGIVLATGIIALYLSSPSTLRDDPSFTIAIVVPVAEHFLLEPFPWWASALFVNCLWVIPIAFLYGPSSTGPGIAVAFVALVTAYVVQGHSRSRALFAATTHARRRADLAKNAGTRLRSLLQRLVPSHVIDRGMTAISRRADDSLRMATPYSLNSAGGGDDPDSNLRRIVHREHVLDVSDILAGAILLHVELTSVAPTSDLVAVLREVGATLGRDGTASLPHCSLRIIAAVGRHVFLCGPFPNVASLSVPTSIDDTRTLVAVRGRPAYDPKGRQWIIAPSDDDIMVTAVTAMNILIKLAHFAAEHGVRLCGSVVEEEASGALVGQERLRYGVFGTAARLATSAASAAALFGEAPMARSSTDGIVFLTRSLMAVLEVHELDHITMCIRQVDGLIAVQGLNRSRLFCLRPMQLCPTQQQQQQQQTDVDHLNAHGATCDTRSEP